MGKRLHLRMVPGVRFTLESDPGGHRVVCFDYEYLGEFDAYTT
jgi:hypothetical protein